MKGSTVRMTRIACIVHSTAVLTLDSQVLKKKTEFTLIGLTLHTEGNPQDLRSLHSLFSCLFARNLGFISDEHLTLFDHICALSNYCYRDMCELRCISP